MVFSVRDPIPQSILVHETIWPHYSKKRQDLTFQVRRHLFAWINKFFNHGGIPSCALPNSLLDTHWVTTHRVMIVQTIQGGFQRARFSPGASIDPGPSEINCTLGLAR